MSLKCPLTSAIVPAVAALLFGAACSTSPHSDSGLRDISPGIRGDLEQTGVPTATTTEEWPYDGQPGKLVRTTSYRLYTTKTSEWFMARMPQFLEGALSHYRSALADLPAPPLRLDTFIMATRPQWERLTRQLMGDEADAYLRIKRGGYSFGGAAVLFDIGWQDTFATAAHEGWHQYRQRLFRESPPIWLEEGIATYMEGYRWQRGSEDGPEFLPWCNVERFDALRRAASRGWIVPLPELLSSSPQDLIGTSTDGREAPALTYYAQVWALIHFLHESGGGKHSGDLRRLITDAANGRMRATVADALSLPRRAADAACRGGPSVFIAYFGEDLAAHAADYDAFIKAAVATGGKDRIVQGLSPIVPNP